MQIASTNSYYTPTQGIASNQAVAGVLPKNGEAAVDAVIAPVEPIDKTSSNTVLYKKPVVYTKQVPKIETEQTKQNVDSLNVAEKGAEAEEAAANSLSVTQKLAEDDVQTLQELKARDQEVRNHEQMHKSIAGQHAGAASYTYQQGPDGHRYAVGGEVSIDMSEVADDAQATLEKMQQIQRAALAPNEPSSQDRQVAAQAGQKAAQALNEIAQEKMDAKQEAAAVLKIQQEKIEEEKQQAKEEQEKADKKTEQNEQVSAAERFALYNRRMTQINEALLKLSIPHQPTVGQLLNARA